MPEPTRLVIRRLAGLLTLPALAVGSLLVFGLLPSSAAAIQLPTTSTISLLTVTLPTTTLTFPSTTITLLATSSTTATTSPVTTTSSPTSTTWPTIGSTSPTDFTLQAPVNTAGGGKPPVTTSSGPEIPTTSVSSERELDAGTTQTKEPAGSSSFSSGNRLWYSVLGFLRPILPPPIAEVLLSPLLVLEAVVRALLESGSALLVPVAALGGCAGWACWRWAPKVDYSISVRAMPKGFLVGWTPDNTSPAAPTTK